MRTLLWLAGIAAAARVALPAPLPAQAARRPALAASDVDDIARLLRLEDRRTFDDTLLTRLLAASHPELRRRAAISVGRIADRRGVALLRARALDADTAVAASTVFAVAQLRDTASTAWLDSLLASDRTPPTVAAEAAAGLGKLKTAEARAALGRYLTRVAATPRTTAAIGDALLAIGRATPRGDLAPIVRWSRSADEELRWRATWALFRPRDPAAVATLLTLSDDRSGLVRSWAVRGLARAQADSAGLASRALARLLAAANDADRRVRAEAVRALGTYDDATAVAALVAALRSDDAWIAVNAAEGLARTRDAAAVRALVAATADDRSCPVRVTALQSLGAAAPGEVVAAAARVAGDAVPYCRATAWQIGWAARDAGLAPEARRAARRSLPPTAEVAERAAALRTMTSWADSTDVPWLLDAYDAAVRDSVPTAASAAVAVLAAVQRRQGASAAPFFARFTPPANAGLRRDVERAFEARLRPTWPNATAADRPLAEYRRIAERWVVRDYEGRPRPQVEWDTPRGVIVLELYAGDAPLATDAIVRHTESGAIIGTTFTRVVPDFVDQQAPVAGAVVQRDEVNRHRLARANLSWATAGLDTGIPGYTLGHTPQPHNEGDFTSLGRVVRGMAAVDEMRLGDAIAGGRVSRP